MNVAALGEGRGLNAGVGSSATTSCSSMNMLCLLACSWLGPRMIVGVDGLIVKAKGARRRSGPE